MTISRSKAKEAFIESAKRTLSEMAFIDASYAGDAEINTRVGQVTYLAFLEPVQGFASLFLPLDCKKLIVENIYGEDWQNLQSDQIDDCLLELLNVLVGNFLSDLFGQDAKRDMGLPRLLFDSAEIEENESQEVFYFDAEGSPFKAVLELKL